MLDLLTQLLAARDAGRPVTYCRLVETRGSTPQKAGAAMLVFPDGSQVGTLGGGCVEAEVKRRALQDSAADAPQVLSFMLDNDYGWDDGLICGGRMQILVDPLRQEASRQYFSALRQQLAASRGCCEAVVFEPEKCGLPSAASFLFDDQGNLAASTQGSSPPASVIENLPDLRSRPRASAEGGVAYLPVLRRCRLLIVGGGHVGLAVSRMAADLDFDVWVVDDRDDFVSAERFPHAQQRLCGDVGTTLRDLEITPETYCLIVTRGHNHDEEALYHLADRGAAYVGMIGSKRKIKLIFDDLLSEGISAAALSRVYAPLGIDIGSQTVPEIAVSICAELVAHRNRNGVVPGRPEPILAGDGSDY